MAYIYSTKHKFFTSVKNIDHKISVHLAQDVHSISKKQAARFHSIFLDREEKIYLMSHADIILDGISHYSAIVLKNKKPCLDHVKKAVKTKDIKTPSGRPSLDCNDNLASQLRGKRIEEVYKLAYSVHESKNMAVLSGQLERRYSHLKKGVQRMALGNLIRGLLKND